MAAGSSHNPFSLIGRGLVGLWMGLAHTIGWLVRAIGRQAATARELDREHQRDGGGLLLIGIAIVLAVAVWFHRAGPIGSDSPTVEPHQVLTNSRKEQAQ